MMVKEKITVDQIPKDIVEKDVEILSDELVNLTVNKEGIQVKDFVDEWLESKGMKDTNVEFPKKIKRKLAQIVSDAQFIVTEANKEDKQEAQDSQGREEDPYEYGMAAGYNIKPLDIDSIPTFMKDLSAEEIAEKILQEGIRKDGSLRNDAFQGFLDKYELEWHRIPKGLSQKFSGIQDITSRNGVEGSGLF